jgi:CheY-like chemotaxis protein
MTKIDQIKELFFIKFKELKWENIKSLGKNKKKVIFADDEKSFTDLISDKLEKSGLYEVYPAVNGQEALSFYTNLGADIIISDIMMDTMTGIELGNRVLKRNQNQKIIFISGWVEGDIIEEKFPTVAGNGNLSFLSKPVTIDQLLKEIYLALNPILKDSVVNCMDKSDLKEITTHMSFEDLTILYDAMREMFIDLSDRLLDKFIDQKSLDSILFPVKDYIKEIGCECDEKFCHSNICTRNDESCAKEKTIRYILQLSTNLRYIFKTVISGDDL